jgi:AraC-like DNA-binding protein
MARIIPLWRTPELSLHRFDHPADHEDQPYEEVAGAYMASFVEAGAFDLEVDGAGWRVGAGDVMLSRPGMRFHASFEGRAFSDVCLSLTYLAAAEDRFDPEGSWEKTNRAVVRASNRTRYLRRALHVALADDQPMAAEYCATEIFRAAPDSAAAPLFSDRKFNWYAERIDYARERIVRDFAEPLTASELARSVGMSLFHFTRVFAELAGAPPHQFLLRTRLDAARAMILQGRGVTETCHASGFSNLSHFTRSFARRFGAPPSRLAA